MEHAGYAPFPNGSGQDLGRIILSIAGVDDKWKSRLASRIDVRAEALALGVATGLVIEIVQPALADRDHARMIRGFDQCRGAEVGMRVGFVRVHADARPDVRLALGNGDDIGPFALAGRDVEEAGD